MNKPLDGRVTARPGAATGTAFVIAGMHRSGTSALARVVSILGAELPHTLMGPAPDNPKGFWESTEIAAVNDSLLDELGTSWDDVLAILAPRDELRLQSPALERAAQALASEYSLTGAVVLKDPRLSLLLDLWVAALSRERYAARIIIPVRNPIETAASLAARNGFSTGRSLLLWLVYFLAAEKSSRQAPRAFLQFSELLDDWRGVMRRVEASLDARFAKWTPMAELEVDAFLSPRDRHQIVSPALLHTRQDIAGWVKQAYDWARRAASGDGEPDPSELDAIARDFAASTQIFAPLIAEQQSSIRKRDQRMDALKDDIRERDQQIGTLEDAIIDAAALRVALAEEIQAKASRNEKLTDVIDVLRVRIEGLTSEALERDTTILTLEGAINDRETLLETFRAQVHDLQARIDDQARDYQQQIDAQARDLREQIEARAGALQKIRAQAQALARLKENENTQTEDLESKRRHIATLEASVKAATDRAEDEAGQRVRLEHLTSIQRAFIAQSRPLLRRIRGRLWRHAWLRSFSYLLDFALLATRHGVRSSAKSIWVARLLRKSGEFDAAHYLQAWDVAAAGQDPVVHYVAVGAGEGRDPSPSFSTIGYLRRYPDVARERANPLAHFVRHGRKEGRIASAVSLQLDEEVGTDRDTVDLYAIRPDDSVAGESKRGAAFMQRFGLLTQTADLAGAVAAINARQSDLETPAPEASIIIPVYGQLAYTLNCLHSLLAHRSTRAFEVIVVDDCSPDDTREWLQRIRGIRVHARAENGGFIKACNEGARLARGRWVVFLNNDTRVVDGWLDELIGHSETHPSAGLVGAKLLYPDRSLQEAGGIVWRDGSAWNYGRNDDSNKPEYCYARQVDYCSGASIALPRDLWEQLGGFDELYAPAYCEDTDLAFRVRHHAAREVWFQPLARVIHYEGVTSGRDLMQGVKAYQVANQKKLYERWCDVLKSHRSNGDHPWLERDRGTTKRALVIEPTTPTPDQDAGSNTVVNTCRVFQMLGYKVTFVPEDNLLFQPRYSQPLQRRGVECAYAPFDQSLEHHLERHGRDYDTVFVFRADTAYKHLDKLRRLAPQAPIAFHNMDIHYLRMERRAELENDAGLLRAAAEMKRRELHVARSVDCVVTHTTDEMEILKAAAPRSEFVVFPYMIDVVGTETPFEAREGLMFLGGYSHTPNVDAVHWFADEVLPLTRQYLPGVVFEAVGANPPPSFGDLRPKGVVVTGRVDDLAPFFNRNRIFVAPLRYGAGMKGKISTAMAHGLPCVITSIAAEGMSLEDGRHVLVADHPNELAEAIARLYTDRTLWLRLQQESLKLVSDAYSVREMGMRVMREVCDAAQRAHAYRTKTHV